MKYLRKTNADGVSVYSHLTDVLATLLETQPASALDAFEGVSASVKGASYKAGAVSTGTAPPELPDPSAPVEAWAAALSTMLAGVAPPPFYKDPAEEPTGKVSNVCSDAKLFACAGVGLSESETYKVYASLVSLQKAKDLASVRFFGKMLGCPGDYYIAEAVYNTPPEPPEEEPPPPPGDPAEASGEGCNKFVYFACTDLSGEWTALPDVTPLQITSSIRIRKYLTGDLAAPVRAYPPFPGEEKEYLRALIARISASSILCPAGKFESVEGAEPTEVEDGEEPRVKPSAAALGSTDGWVTRYMGILDSGYTKNPPIEEEDEEKAAQLAAAQQPEISYLSPLPADAWTATTYSHGGPPVAIAKSLAFPGALCAYQLAKGGQEVLASLYIGYGQPRLETPFVMEAPPAFEAEPDEVHEAQDTPLETENEAFLAAETARIAAEAAEAAEE